MVDYVPVIINRSTPDDGLGDDAFDWSGKTNDNMAALFGGITITAVTFEWVIADLTVGKLKVTGDTEIEGTKGTEVVIKITDDGAGFTPGETTGKFSVFSADASGIGPSNAGEVDVTYADSTGGEYNMSFKLRNASGFNEILRLEGSLKKAFFAGALTIAGAVRKNGTHPSFFATSSAAQNNVTGNGEIIKVLFGLKKFDQGTNYSTSTSIATVQESGNYLFDVQAFLAGITSSHTLATLELITTNDSYSLYKGNLANLRDGTSNQATIGRPIKVPMDALDTAFVNLMAANGTTVIDILSDTSFAITRFHGSLEE